MKYRLEKNSCCYFTTSKSTINEFLLVRFCQLNLFCVQLSIFLSPTIKNTYFRLSYIQLYCYLYRPMKCNVIKKYKRKYNCSIRLLADQLSPLLPLLYGVHILFAFIAIRV